MHALENLSSSEVKDMKKVLLLLSILCIIFTACTVSTYPGRIVVSPAPGYYYYDPYPYYDFWYGPYPYYWGPHYYHRHHRYHYHR